MTDPILFSSTIQALKSALDGLSVQQEVIGQNISNVDTPGYRAQKADFRATLRRILNQDGKVVMQTTHKAHLSSTRPVDSVQISLREGGALRADGNNVDIDVELTQMTETVIQYQALSQLISRKFAGIKQIIGR
ncbi:MAG: Flagellar basal-body rod protein FlgB [Anaerolineae bacterium]|nr:MAG: Flagellar basal-body rod protein FlgB [Anaerolineae bacterium]